MEKSEQSTAASSGKGDTHPVLMGAWESFPGGEAANADTHSLHLPIFFLFQLNRSCHSPAFPSKLATSQFHMHHLFLTQTGSLTSVISNHRASVECFTLNQKIAGFVMRNIRVLLFPLTPEGMGCGKVMDTD